jgi:hypothetical protein
VAIGSFILRVAVPDDILVSELFLGKDREGLIGLVFTLGEKEHDGWPFCFCLGEDEETKEYCKGCFHELDPCKDRMEGREIKTRQMNFSSLTAKMNKVEISTISQI